jgi:hypothetical protein
LKDSDELLWNDYTNHSKLSVIYMIVFLYFMVRNILLSF